MVHVGESVNLGLENDEKVKYRRATVNDDMATQLNEFVRELLRQAENKNRQRDFVSNARVQLLARTQSTNKDTMDCIMQLTQILNKCTPSEAEQDSLHNTQGILDEFN